MSGSKNGVNNWAAPKMNIGKDTIGTLTQRKAMRKEIKGIVELVLVDMDGKKYHLPIKKDKEIGIEYVELPEDWTEEMIKAYHDFMYPNGYTTLSTYKNGERRYRNDALLDKKI